MKARQTRREVEVKDYVVEISAPTPTYLGMGSDEDDSTTLPRTTDPDIALRFEKMQDANAACKQAAKSFPVNSFRVNVLPKLKTKG